ncbi:MAG: ATPase [Methanobacterium sp.]|nr:ATPase [Methanobacterium sp.]
MNEEIIKFLACIGVDARYISLYDRSIFINNLRFSRFSRKREEQFLRNYPQWEVVRSKDFQKICIRASRVLSQSLKPGEKIFIFINEGCADLILYLILESYKRKYGIEIIYDDKLDSSMESEVDSIALSLTLDQEVINIINQMINGHKIRLSETKTNEGLKIIYPLINIPDSWIKIWEKNNNYKCTFKPMDGTSRDLIRFLEQYIPDVRENMFKSATILS